MNEIGPTTMTAVYMEPSMENMQCVKTEEGVIHSTSSSYDTPASSMHIHANAADESFSEVDSAKSDFIPILTEAMREIIDDHQLSASGDDNSNPIQTVPQQEEQQQYPTYVTVGIIPSDVELKNNCRETEDVQKGEVPPLMESVHPPSENQNQNNCYQEIRCPNDVNSNSTGADTIEVPEVNYSVSKPVDCMKTRSQTMSQEPCPVRSASPVKPLTRKGPVRNSLTVEGPVLNGFQKPKLNIVQQILEAFKASSKREMHPSEVYDAIQKLYPYYRQLNQKKKKSWMSSVRHALTSSRFKGRKMRDNSTRSIIRKGSLWSLNENYNKEYSGSKKRGHSSRSKGSSRRKQKLSGNTRKDFEDSGTFSTNAPQRIAPLPSFPSTHPQISHMQSTFAPGTVVFPGYPMMGYMPHQPQPVYHQPMPSQPWLAVQHQPGSSPSPVKHAKKKQMPSLIPNSSPRQCHINMPGTPMQTHGQSQDIRSLVYQTMNIPANNISSNQAFQQNFNQAQPVIPPPMVLQHAYQTPAVSYSYNPVPGQMTSQNVQKMQQTVYNPVPGQMTSQNIQKMQQTVYNPLPGQMTSQNVQKMQQTVVTKKPNAPNVTGPQAAASHTTGKPGVNMGSGNAFESSSIHQVAPSTSLHWTYAQPQQMTASQDHQFSCAAGPMQMENQNVNKSRGTPSVAVSSSIYTASLGQNVPVPPIGSVTTSSCSGNKLMSYSFAPFGEVQPGGNPQYTNSLQPVHLTSSA